MDDNRYQAFQTKSSPEIITIPTCHDPKSSRRVVRWKDIQQYFKDAQGILNGRCSVLFLTDDDLEDLIPLRIAHHPGVVLEVLVADNQSSTNETLGSSSSTVGPHMPSEVPLSFHVSCPIHSYSHQPMGLIEDTPVSTDQFVRDHPPRLQLEMDNTMSIPEQVQQLSQQIQQMQQEMQQQMREQIGEVLQQIQHTLQKVDIAPQKTQQYEQQTRELVQEIISKIQQQIQQLQERMNEKDPVNDLSMDSTKDEIPQTELGTPNRHSFIQQSVQALIRTSMEDRLFPRLFIVLPKNIPDDDKQRALSSSEFRLYFLCECNTRGAISREVHMTDHQGYDLEKPEEFFDKFGLYTLTMMYMVKYGATASGFIVPPLAQLKLPAGIEESHGHRYFSKDNISRLVDSAITHIEGMTRTDGNSTNTTLHGNLRAADLRDMESYLEVNEGERVPGELYRLILQDQHCPWVCSEHLREMSVQDLQDAVSAVGGAYSKDHGKIDIKVASGKVTKALYDIVAKICTIQHVNGKLSLVVDCERFSLTLDAFQDVREVCMTISRLEDLAVDDLEFIQRCRLTQLKIKYTPQENDENRLLCILQKSSRLEELHVGCLGERSLALIGLVVSAREEAIQEGGSSSLRIFQLMEEELKPYNFYRTWDDFDHITTSITFSENSTKFSMDTRVKLQQKQQVAEGDWISNFFRQYGWSIRNLDTCCMFSDHLAALMDNSTQIHGSQLTHVVLAPRLLTDRGLDALTRVIKRSQRLELLWIYLVNLERESYEKKAELAIERFGKKLHRLHLNGNSIESWLPQFAQVFPTKAEFPAMEILSVKSTGEFSNECIQWLIAMVSNPTQPTGFTTEGYCTGTHQQKMEPPTIPVRLKTLQLYNAILCPQDWEALIKAIDFSSMLVLMLEGTNFSQEQLDLMLDRIANTEADSISLQSLNINRTDLVLNSDKDALRERIQKAAPRVNIQGL